MSERIYGVALEDSRPLADGKHHECWVSVGGVVTQPLSRRVSESDLVVEPKVDVGAAPPSWCPGGMTWEERDRLDEEEEAGWSADDE